MRMMKRSVVICLFLFVCSQLLYSISFADDAEVLPKGVSRVFIEGKIYFRTDERYNQNGDVEKIAHDYNTSLDSSILPALSLVESFFGMPPGSASVGSSVVSFKYDLRQLNFQFDRGFTDKLTVGVYIPYWWATNNVDARLNASTATVGKNAALNTLAPLSIPGTDPLTTNDVQNLLGKGLDINGDGTIDIPGYGFKRVETWNGDGIGDIEAGVRYQYLKTDVWRLAFTGGVRFPTGKMKDQDNLVDYALGYGAYAILFRLNNDFIAIKNLLIDATVKYDLYISTRETLRIPESADRPITDVKEDVRRKYGNIFELETMGRYEFSKGLTFSLLYRYAFAQKDHVTGDHGEIKSLEDETDFSEHIGIASLCYSTIPLYKEKKFPLPVTVSLSYRNRFAGSNNVLRTQYIAGAIQVYF